VGVQGGAAFPLYNGFERVIPAEISSAVHLADIAAAFFRGGFPAQPAVGVDQLYSRCWCAVQCWMNRAPAWRAVLEQFRVRGPNAENTREAITHPTQKTFGGDGKQGAYGLTPPRFKYPPAGD